jgi:hypothetical protein
MNRRESLKAIGITTLSAGLLLDACKVKESEAEITNFDLEQFSDRQPIEIAKDKRLNEEKFFTAHEMETITVLGDLIIPKDSHSGNASDAKVPEFIEFIAKDQPEHQVPLRGGLRWLDVQCLNLYKKPFKDCNESDQKAMLDQIAYPNNVKPHMLQGAAFFDRIRSLVATGFFTSKMGMEDLGYVGNRPNKWEGVPEDIIKQYQLEEFNF